VSERSGEQPVDLAVIQADDALLDALGRGGPAPGDDDLAGLLAAWRADLATDLGAGFADGLGAGFADGLGDSLAVESEAETGEAETGEAETGEADDVTTEIPVVPIRRRHTGFRRVLAGAVAATVLLGGAALGAHRSDPNGPLWPITRVLYPQLADSRTAEHTIAQAQDAAAAGRYDDARRLLDVAAGQAGQIDDPATRQRLLDRIDELRRSLPATGPATPATTAPSATAGVPSPTTAPVPSAAATGPGATPGGGGGGGRSTAPGGLPPIVPSLPLPSLPGPTLPLPLPTLPLPTPLLPTLLPGLTG
jgi:hypothetical protein